VVSVLLLVLAGWAALSVVLGLLLCRGMRRPSSTPAPPAVLPSKTSSASTVADATMDAEPNRTAASA
jgi:hypothetical protein